MLDDLAITDEHPNPQPPLITAKPNKAEPGRVTRVRFKALEPLFTRPGATLFLGPGFLVENFRVLTPHVAVADVLVGPRVLPIDHGLVLDTPDLIRVGSFNLTSCGPLGCLRPNELPVGELEFDPAAIAPGEAFPVAFVFDDPDGDIVQAEIAIDALPSETIVFSSPYRTYRTDLSDPLPERLAVIVPGLPPGDYVALGILRDGMGDVQVTQVPFTIPGSP